MFPSQNVVGAKSVMSEQPKEDRVIMLTRGFLDPLINWMGPSHSYELTVSFLGGEDGGTPNIHPSISNISQLAALKNVFKLLELREGFS